MRIMPFSRGALLRFDRRAPYALVCLMRRQENVRYQRAFFLQLPRPVPGQFLETFLRQEFTKDGDRVKAIATFVRWNGSYHDPSFDGLAEGQAVVLVRGRKVKHIFSRIRRAASRALAAWEAAQAESVRARLVERRIWRCEGD